MCRKYLEIFRETKLREYYLYDLISHFHTALQVLKNYNFRRFHIETYWNYTYNKCDKSIYPAMTAFTDQYSLPNIFLDIGQL